MKFKSVVDTCVLAVASLLILSPVSLAVSAATPTPTPVLTPRSAPISAAFFGMDVNHLLAGTPWPTLSFGTLRLWDTGTLWGNLNPSQGTYSWANLDSQIALAKSNNVGILYTFGGTPAWAIPTNIGIQSISRTSGVVTVTTTTPHGVYYSSLRAATSQTQITIVGVSDPSFDGTFYLTGTPNATTFSYALSAPDASSSGGTMSAVCGGVYTGSSSCSQAAANMSDWDSYVAALVTHVGPGVIKYWEMWNEANLPGFWEGDLPTLINMNSVARKIIKANDPNAIILSPSNTIDFALQSVCDYFNGKTAPDGSTMNLCGSTWLKDYLQEGGGSYVDAIAFHGYPELTESPESILGMIELQENAMAANGVGNLPLLDTESSWGTDVGVPATSDQVAFLARHLILEQSAGLQHTVWYAYDNSEWGTLYTAAGGLNAVGTAYGLLYTWLTGATLTQACAVTASNSVVYVCQYSRPWGYKALIVWTTSGTSVFQLPNNAWFPHYRDLYGNITNLAAQSVPISTSPILVETSSDF